MKDRIYLVRSQFVEEKVRKIFDLPGEIGFTSRLGLVTGLREQELLYIKEKPVCADGHGCDCENLHLVNCRADRVKLHLIDCDVFQLLYGHQVLD
jgi:hypothetical protein